MTQEVTVNEDIIKILTFPNNSGIHSILGMNSHGSQAKGLLNNYLKRTAIGFTCLRFQLHNKSMTH